MKIKFSNFTRIKSSKCELIYFNKIKNFIRNLERVFFLIAKKECVRGNHAHKKCSQFFFSLGSSTKIYLDDGKKEKIILLRSGEIIKVHPLIWVKVKLKKNQIVGVFCNKKYTHTDYIRNYKNFMKIIKKSQ